MTTAPQSYPDAGRGAALLVYGLYLLSIPSAGIFALIGVIIALSARADAGQMARTHLDDQIRVWFVSFYWHIALALIWLLGMVLTLVIIGFPILLVVACGWFILMIWFTVKAVLGLLALLDGRPR